MPSRRLALIQTKQGPWVCTYGVPNPHVKITGLKTGLVRVELRFADDSGHYHMFRENGLYPIESAGWTRISLIEGDARAVICEVISVRAA